MILKTSRDICFSSANCIFLRSKLFVQEYCLINELAYVSQQIFWINIHYRRYENMFWLSKWNAWVEVVKTIEKATAKLNKTNMGFVPAYYSDKILKTTFMHWFININDKQLSISSFTCAHIFKKLIIYVYSFKIKLLYRPLLIFNYYFY